MVTDKYSFHKSIAKRILLIGLALCVVISACNSFDSKRCLDDAGLQGLYCNSVGEAIEILNDSLYSYTDGDGYHAAGKYSIVAYADNNISIQFESFRSSKSGYLKYGGGFGDPNTEFKMVAQIMSSSIQCSLIISPWPEIEETDYVKC
jgi:hypothetical protein